MKNERLFAFLFPLTFLLGGALPATPTPMSQSSLTGNWQIQAGTAITSPPTVPYLVGALQDNGGQLSGTFSTGQPSVANPVVVISYSGTYNSTTASMILSSTPPLPDGQTIATLAV